MIQVLVGSSRSAALTAHKHVHACQGPVASRRDRNLPEANGYKANVRARALRKRGMSIGPGTTCATSTW